MAHYWIFNCRAGLTTALLCVSFGFPILAKDFELAREELVSRHLVSVGSKEAVAAVRFRVATGKGTGKGRVFQQLGLESGLVSVSAELQTGPEQVRFGLESATAHYPFEGFFFDGKDIRLAAFDPIQRSWIQSEQEYKMGQLTRFFSRCPNYVRAGLVGGVISACWPLLNPERQASLLRSVKKGNLDGRSLIALEYHIPGTRGAILYFDPETYRHVATRHRVQRGRSHRHYVERMTLTEYFGNFLNFEGKQLPTSWTLVLELPRETTRWEIELSEIRHLDRPEVKRRGK